MVEVFDCGLRHHHKAEPKPGQSGPGLGAHIQVLRPRLPSAEKLLPYLQRIDAERIYANRGPLNGELEDRLAERLGLDSGAVACASSGTAALVGAILAAAGPATTKRPLALVPSFTFAATAVAAERCGYEPHFCDVGAESWVLDPERIAEHPLLSRVGVVVPVAAFGRPVPPGPWEELAQRGVPVVADGAASLDLLTAGDGTGGVLTALSFHATKSFSCGEGGAVVGADIEQIGRVAQCLNFGFGGTRESRAPSTNGKLSEYHAAVGLAEMADWEVKLGGLHSAASRYREAFEAAGLHGRLVASPEISAGYLLFRARSPEEAAELRAELQRAAIGCRLWYGQGLHRHEHFSGLSSDSCEVTDELAPSLLGIPLAPDLTDSAIDRVTAALALGAHR